MASRSHICSLTALTLSLFWATNFTCSGAALASDDAVRNQLARKDCVRGKFKDFYLQGQGGDPPGSYTGRVFKLSQDYPSQLSPMENYPWLKINFKNGGPVDPRAYLQALLDYGLEGNIGADFYVEDNKVRKWYGIPWMDWNTEVAADWPEAPTAANSSTGSLMNSMLLATRSAPSSTILRTRGRAPT